MVNSKVKTSNIGNIPPRAERQIRANPFQPLGQINNINNTMSAANIIKLLLSVKLTLFSLDRWSKSQSVTSFSFRSLLSVLSRKLRISTIRLSSCFTRGAVYVFQSPENYKQRLINSSFSPLAESCQSHQSIKSFNLMASNGGLKVRQPRPSAETKNAFDRVPTFAGSLSKTFEAMSIGKHLLTVVSIRFSFNKSSGQILKI